MAVYCIPRSCKTEGLVQTATSFSYILTYNFFTSCLQVLYRDLNLLDTGMSVSR